MGVSRRDVEVADGFCSSAFASQPRTLTRDVSATGASETQICRRGNSKKRGQIAFEYMLIVGIVLIFVIPIWAYVTSVQQQTSQELSLSYAQNAAEQLADVASLVYSQGPPAKINVRAYIPAGINEVTMNNKSITFKVETAAGLSDVYAISAAELNGTIPTGEGTYWFSVEAKAGYVQINQIEQ